MAQRPRSGLGCKSKCQANTEIRKPEVPLHCESQSRSWKENREMQFESV